MSSRKSTSKKEDVKSRIIAKQSDEIEKLKDEIAKLKKTCFEKDEVIYSIEPMRAEMQNVIDDLNEKRNKYKSLVDELEEMKKIMDEEVYRGRWNIIRMLLK